MSNRILFAATIAAGTMVASGAYAGSPYYNDQGIMTRHARTAASTQAPRSDYRATASEDQMGAPATPAASTASAPAVQMTPDGYLPAQKGTFLFDHAVGTDGSP